MNVKILSPNSESPFVSGWYELASDSHFWMRGRIAALVRQLKRNKIPLTQGWRGLEIGCGHGVLKSQLERKTKWIVDGCDLDLASLQNNPQGQGNVFLYNIFDRLDFLKEYYDFIFLYDVIEHIADVSAFMKASLFHLKPGGYVFINVPALESLRSVYDSVVGHCRRYDKNMLTDTLKDCGLEQIHINFWGLTFIPLLQMRKNILRNVSENKIVEKGFRPPGHWVNALLTTAIQMETMFLPNPFSGTSLMAIARKPQ